MADELFAAGKIQDKCEDAGFYERLSKLEAQWPSASVLVHKRGILPAAVSALWPSAPLLSVAQQVLGGEIVGQPVWNIRSCGASSRLGDRSLTSGQSCYSAGRRACSFAPLCAMRWQPLSSAEFWRMSSRDCSPTICHAFAFPLDVRIMPICTRPAGTICSSPRGCSSLTQTCTMVYCCCCSAGMRERGAELYRACFANAHHPFSPLVAVCRLHTGFVADRQPPRRHNRQSQLLCRWNKVCGNGSSRCG